MLIAEAASKPPVVKDADFEDYDFGPNMLPKRVQGLGFRVQGLGLWAQYVTQKEDNT